MLKRAVGNVDPCPGRRSAFPICEFVSRVDLPELDRPLLPVTFDHADHRETACADCHHNFVDDTGGGTCYNCHKYEPEIAAHIEDMFHEFCFTCHVQMRVEGEESGPMRECGGCHQ